MTHRPTRRSRPRIVIAVVWPILITALLFACSSRRGPDKAAVRQELFAEFQPVKLSNCEMGRLGEANDGGYVVCTNLLSRMQTAYSYGINGTDGWGCEMSLRYHVTTHEYDCFNTTVPVCEGGSTRFHAECVGPTKTTKEDRPFDSLEHHLVANGDAGHRLVVKMDIEGDEWETFAATPDGVFSQIDQLSVEFHDVDQPRFVATIRRLKQHFHVVNVHYNNWVCDAAAAPFPASAFEVLLVNKNVGVPDPVGQPLVPNPLDQPNNRRVPDCQRAAAKP